MSFLNKPFTNVCLIILLNGKWFELPVLKLELVKELFKKPAPMIFFVRKMAAPSLITIPHMNAILQPVCLHTLLVNTPQ